VTNGEEQINVKAFVSEYFRNTNGPRDFLVAKVNYDELYATRCEEQAAHMAATQNYTDEGITSLRIRGGKIQYKFYTPREYDNERAENHNDRKRKVETIFAPLAQFNMRIIVGNAIRDSIEKMVELVTDQVVAKPESLAEKERREETQREKHVEATPEEDEDMVMVYEEFISVGKI